jgi:hypothetical protein
MAPSSEIDALFQLPLTEFTSARNALASRLRKAGRAADSERVKALQKPPATAWAVNQLYWRHRPELEKLLAAGEKVRQAQSGRGDLRALLDQRRALISALTDRAAGILEEAGHAVSHDARRRVSITLESLASWGRANTDVQAGRLTADLEPLGFDGLAAILDGRKFEPAKVLQFRRKASEQKQAEDEAAAQASARRAVKAAEQALTSARRAAERSDAAVEKANARAAALQAQKVEIAARCTKAEAEVAAATREARKTAQALAEAERALARARAALE